MSGILWSPDDLAPDDRRLWDAMGDATPRFSVMPTPGAPSELPAVEVITRKIGTPLIPWQAWAARVMTERRIDDPRRYRWPDILTTVERQSGKTTTVRGVLLTRAILYRHRRAFYTAQTGKDASERWFDLVERVRHSPLRSGVTVRKAAGSQRLVVTSTESRIAPFPPTPESLHGYTPHDVAADEIFSLDDVQGNDLIGAIKPAQQTLADRQVLWLSTAGHAGSTFLRSKVDAARAALAVPDSPLGIVEWSLDPDLDPYDEANWSCHPGLGHLITRDDLRALAAEVPEGEWRRAFWNQWVEESDPVYDMRRWAALQTTLAPVSLGDVVLGYAVDADRRRAAIVAAWQLDGRQAVKLVWSSQDVDALVPMLARLDSEHRPAALVADPGGIMRGVIDALSREVGEWREPRSLTPSEWVIASTSIVDKLSAATIVHDGDAELTDALATALTRSLGEAWALSHRSRAEVLAMAAALRGLDDLPAVDDDPVIYFGPDDS